MTLADPRVGLRAYMLDDAGIAALVADRVYAVIARQGQREPHIVVHRISGVGDHHMQGPSGLTQSRVQIDCYALDLDVASTLANLVKERLDGFHGSILWGEDSPAEAIVVQGIFFAGIGEDYHDATQLYRVRPDFLVWYSER